MTPDFHSKLKLLNQKLKELGLNGAPKEEILSAINRSIEHIESNIGPFDPHAYFLILEDLKNLREPLLPTVEDVQAIYSRDTKQD